MKKKSEDPKDIGGSGPDKAEWKLVSLDSDHPGFRDPQYRKRREEIAQIAITWDSSHDVPDAPYSLEEHAIWHTISKTLVPLHDQLACKEILHCRDCLNMSLYRIPQLSDINLIIYPKTKFKMAPVAGLVSPRDFLQHMAKKTFLSTQYIRHHSRPWYTPEPDVVHELIGHAASLVDANYAALNHAFGLAATQANDERLLELERIYCI